MKYSEVRLPRTVIKIKKGTKKEIIEIQKDGSVVGWCEVLRKLKILQCDGRCSTCYCG